SQICPALVNLKRILKFPGDIFQPFIAFVMMINKWKFYEFISTNKEVHPHGRQFQNKGREKAERNCIDPHINKITDKSPPGISSCPEYTADDRGIHSLPYYIIHIDKKHNI